MKPPSSPPPTPPPPQDLEDVVLQAVRESQQAEPCPALDASILRTAAEHAAKIRKTSTDTHAAPETQLPAPVGPSWLKGFSRWLIGNGQRGHLGQLLAAASVFALVGVGIGFWGNMPVDTLRKSQADKPEGKTLTTFGSNEIPPASPASVPAGEQAERIALALPPPPMLALEENADLAYSKASPETAKTSLRASAAPAPSASATAPPKAAEKKTAEETPKKIEAELKRILQLRRTGEEEKAQLLLRQLRERYPDGKIDERLRQLENEETK